MGTVIVRPAELNASAGVARSIGEDLAKSCTSAITDSRTAVGQLTGWSVVAALEQVATAWDPVLATVRDRFGKTADNLAATAQAYTDHEDAVTDVWQKNKIAEPSDAKPKGAP
ncbi:hypothetical protein [Streptomyces sp. NRRL WC-3742]|uniref:hypothetical protein n=1 Tax=Streptomyces sp. NRRL WC-3742 TaxID=1463934 RepID=UPI0004CBCE01|nr:hypothetical protein [Streptomyces sp. NRRL WC-3742]